MIDFRGVTEIGGERGSHAQLDRSYQRYTWASSFCRGKDVLEVGCGVGQGLGLVAQAARSTLGVDIEARNLAHARDTYRDRPRVRLARADAEALPCASERFDVVLLFEALYYLPKPEAFIREARRVLRPEGLLLLCSANKDLPDFNPSPFSHRYYGPPELCDLLRPDFPRVEVLAGDAVSPSSARAGMLRWAKQWAVRLHLMPRTMRSKQLLKRIIFGPLVELPRELHAGSHRYEPPIPVASAKPDQVHRVLYVIAFRDR